MDKLSRTSQTENAPDCNSWYWLPPCGENIEPMYNFDPETQAAEIKRELGD